MSNQSCFFTFYTLTPLHAGAGDSAGAIDLPVEREKHTEYPCVYASGMKGSLREYFRRGEIQEENIFGKEGTEGASGQVVFTDAKILFFPVRASEGVFKWVSCPFVIQRFYRDVKFVNPSHKVDNLEKLSVSELNGFSFVHENKTIILEDYPVALSKIKSADDPYKTILADLSAVTKDHGVDAEKDLQQRLIIVSDDVFKALVTTATQVIARNVLEHKNNTKKSENLWYEEVVPADAIFYTVMLPTFNNDASKELTEKLGKAIAGKILQIGGNETIGYGLVGMSQNCAGHFNPAPEVNHVQAQK